MNCPSCGHDNIDGVDRCENCLAPFRDLDIPRVDAAESFAQSVMEDHLDQLTYERPVLVAPADPAGEVARRMKEANTGCALVLEENKLVGIFTEHDILLHLAKCVGNESESNEAGAAGVEHGADYVSGRPETSAELLLGTDTPLEELNSETWAGMGDSSAAAQSLAAFRANFNIPVGALMSKNPETLHQKDSVAEALNRMSIGRYRHLPVKQNDGSYAVASIKSVLKYIAKEDW